MPTRGVLVCLTVFVVAFGMAPLAASLAELHVLRDGWGVGEVGQIGQRQLAAWRGPVAASVRPVDTVAGLVRPEGDNSTHRRHRRRRRRAPAHLTTAANGTGAPETGAPKPARTPFPDAHSFFSNTRKRLGLTDAPRPPRPRLRPADTPAPPAVRDGSQRLERILRALRDRPTEAPVPDPPSWARHHNISFVYTWRLAEGRDMLRTSMHLLSAHLPWHTGTVYVVVVDERPRREWDGAEVGVEDAHPRARLVSSRTLLPRRLAGVPAAVGQVLHKLDGVGEVFVHIAPHHLVLRPIEVAEFVTLGGGVKLPTGGAVLDTGYFKAQRLALERAHSALAVQAEARVSETDPDKVASRGVATRRELLRAQRATARSLATTTLREVPDVPHVYSAKVMNAIQDAAHGAEAASTAGRSIAETRTANAARLITVETTNGVVPLLMEYLHDEHLASSSSIPGVASAPSTLDATAFSLTPTPEADALPEGYAAGALYHSLYSELHIHRHALAAVVPGAAGSSDTATALLRVFAQHIAPFSGKASAGNITELSSAVNITKLCELRASGRAASGAWPEGIWPAVLPQWADDEACMRASLARRRACRAPAAAYEAQLAEAYAAGHCPSDGAAAVYPPSYAASAPGGLSRRPHGDPFWKQYHNMTFVFTWQNVTSSRYIKKKRAAEKRGTYGVHGGSDAELLRASLRLLEMHCPWHTGEVVVVAPGGVPPAWLDAGHPRVRVVAEEDFLTEKATPTWNRRVVALHLHRIPALTDIFVHFDGYPLLGRPVHVRDFVTDDGGIRLYLEGEVKAGEPSAVGTTAALLPEGAPRRAVQRGPVVYHKAVCKYVKKRWKRDIVSTYAHTFPSDDDLILGQLHHGALQDQDAHPALKEYRYAVHHRDQEQGAKEASVDAMTLVLADAAAGHRALVRQVHHPHLFLTVRAYEATDATRTMLRSYLHRAAPFPSGFEVNAPRESLAYHCAAVDVARQMYSAEGVREPPAVLSAALAPGVARWSEDTAVFVAKMAGALAEDDRYTSITAEDAVTFLDEEWARRCAAGGAH
eukprot:TRINITY_DN12692_c0_g2_i1.p1 TRINITY_DN12692_c0_g2~~TRINITY_DN12692_c0_g2_i1.p1  ORF type:complete len:1048 (+),score=166.78 TRINITY_DN12692_c0_g2_i1:120-3263(+)